MNPIWYPYTSGSLEEAACHVPFRIFCIHVFDVAKKTSSEQNYIWYPYTSRSKKRSKEFNYSLELGPGGEGGIGWDGMGWNGIGCNMMGWDGIG